MTECTYTLCVPGPRWSNVPGGTPAQYWCEYQPDVQSSVARTAVPDVASSASVSSRRPCPSLMVSRHRSGSTVGTAALECQLNAWGPAAKPSSRCHSVACRLSKELS